MRRWVFAVMAAAGLVALGGAWLATVGLVGRRRAAMEMVCPCPQAEHEAWAKNGRLHLVCICPGSEGR